MSQPGDPFIIACCQYFQALFISPPNQGGVQRSTEERKSIKILQDSENRKHILLESCQKQRCIGEAFTDAH